MNLEHVLSYITMYTGLIQNLFSYSYMFDMQLLAIATGTSSRYMSIHELGLPMAPTIAELASASECDPSKAHECWDT